MSFLFIVFILLVGGTPSHAIPPTLDPALEWSLIGYWKMDSETGGVTPDSSNSGLNGMVKGNATLMPGEGTNGSGAYRLDGNSDRIQITRSSKLLPTNNQITVSAWFNVMGGTYENWQHPLSKWDNYYLRVADNLRQVRFGIFSGHNTESSVGYADWTNFNPVIDYNTWYHAVGTYDGNTARLYLNGVEVASKDLGITMYTGNNYDLMLGAVSWSSSQEELNGMIDEVAIWNRALSSSEITEIYNYGSGAPPVVPEPVSSILFLTGGMTMGLRQYVKRKKRLS
jgi:hypothetical protein